MKIYPCYQKAQHFTICDVSRQELVNLLEGVSTIGIANSPWGKGAIRMFEQALAACHEYQSSMWDGNDPQPVEKE